jgi:hypothetical protein
LRRLLRSGSSRCWTPLSKSSPIISVCPNESRLLMSESEKPGVTWLF